MEIIIAAVSNLHALQKNMFMQMFVYTETTSLWFQTADWKTCNLRSAFIYQYKTGTERPREHFLLFQNKKSGNESWKEKKEPQTRSFFKKYSEFLQTPLQPEEAICKPLARSGLQPSPSGNTWQHIYSILILPLFVITVYLKEWGDLHVGIYHEVLVNFYFIHICWEGLFCSQV